MSRLPDYPDAAYDQWQFSDEPFVSELCLMLMVALRHQVERELLRLAARVTDDGKALSFKQYLKRVEDERESLRQRGGSKKLTAKLNLESFPEWQSMETLRLIANCYKHEPSQIPDQDLIRRLGLDPTLRYGPLAESPGFREGLALWLGLDKYTELCDIAEELLKRADQFLADVAQQPIIGKVKPGAVSLHPKDWLH